MRRIASVPARINVIGEHTDHFGGLSLAFSSQHRLVLTAIEREEGNRGDETIVRLWEAAGGWKADIRVESEIPIGAGLSSSAALCVAVVMCAQDLDNAMEIAIEAQKIEHQELHSTCGLMDQIAITHSSRGSAVLIDFKEMAVQNFSLPADWTFKLVDTGVRRSLRETNYSNPSTALEARLRHAREESERVRTALTCDATQLGPLLNQSHASISEIIRASTPEIDSMVREIQSTPGVLGARLMGGGFGGLVLALVENEEAIPGESLVSSNSAFVEEAL